MPNLPCSALPQFDNYVDIFLKAREEKRKKQLSEVGMILGILSEYGGEVSPEQMGTMQSNLGGSPMVQGLIKSIFQPTYEQTKTPVQVAGESGGTDIVDEISQGKLTGYKMPGAVEREVTKKKQLMAAEHPYKQELLETQIESKEKIAQLQLQGVIDKITGYQEVVKEKLEAAARISADKNVTSKDIAAANNDTKMSITNLTQQVELLKTILQNQSREKVADVKAATEKEKIGAKEATPTSATDVRKLFNDATKQYRDATTKEWKTLTREQADQVKSIAEQDGYEYSETGVKGWPLVGGGGFKPNINYEVSKVSGKPKQVPKSEKSKIKQLRTEAEQAIKSGKNAALVKRRFKELTGEDY